MEAGFHVLCVRIFGSWAGARLATLVLYYVWRDEGCLTADKVLPGGFGFRVSLRLPFLLGPRN